MSSSRTGSRRLSSAEPRSAFLLAALTASTATAPLAAQVADATFVDEIEARVRDVMRTEPVPGMAIGVVDGETLVYSAGFGLADRATGRPVTDSTLFQIGSTSKTFTSMLFCWGRATRYMRLSMKNSARSWHRWQAGLGCT